MLRSLKQQFVFGVVAAACCLATVPAMADTPIPNPWMDPALVVQMNAAQTDTAREAIARRRAKLLLAAMSLEQKFQQLTGAKPEVLPELPQCYGARHVSGIAALNIPTFRITNGPVGLGQNDCVSLDVAKMTPNVPGFGVISASYTHPSSAKATALPSAIAAAASFDPKLGAMYGALIGTEMTNLGLHVFEAPGVNLARLPILGRNFEYFGEDPFLSGTMAVAETRALQSRGLIAMVKHYVANEQETNRQTIQTTVDRQTLRELYLLPFEMAVRDGKAAAVMCAYNYVNGQSSCENRELLTDVLRGDWGFSGYVQTDFFAMKGTVAPLRNGLDHEMPVPLHWASEKMRSALAAGEISEAQVDTALERRFAQAFKAGIFDRPVVRSPIDFADGGRKAREIGGRSTVLLQNNGALPLKSDLRTVVLIGKASQVYAQQAVAGGAVVGEPMGAGGGSSDVVPNYTVSPVEGLRNALGKQASVRLILVDDENAAATLDGRKVAFADVLALAGAADAVVVMAGTIAEEGADRASFTDETGKTLAASAGLGSGLDWYAPRSNKIATLTGENAAHNSQTTAMIEALMAVRSTSRQAMAQKLVLVLKDNAGVGIPPALLGRRGPAILEAWFPGQEDGNIVADVLLGRVNPSGKLPVTFPLSGRGFLDSITAAQFPGVPADEAAQQTVTYREQLDIGYRWYDSHCTSPDGSNPCVAFPFGHGLSYTRFAIDQPKLVFDATLKVWRTTARVRNVGSRAGAEVVQVYLSLPASANAVGARQPPKRLVGFERIELEPGASGEVTVTIDPNASNHPLAVWDQSHRQWVIPEGSFAVWLGRSSAARELMKAGSISR